MRPKISLYNTGLKKRLWAIIVLVSAYLVFIALGDLIPQYWSWIGFRAFERSILTLGFVVIMMICLSGLALSDKLSTLAIRDGLTGFYNTVYVKARLQEEIDRSVRYKYPLSLLMIDPDDFKVLNDKFGQVAGDQLLKSFAAMLSEIVRASDVVGRLGGDNFLVILPQTAVLDAAAVAERIRKETALSDFQLLTHREKVYHFTISIGVYGSPLQKQTADEVLGMTDAALYRAKKDGKNRVVVFIK
jgi:diguanylate cyclase (GGDEF)-like protein